jgi:ATP-binding cassette subfamily B protein IrtB
MFDAYRRFFAFAGKQAGTWKKGLVFEFLRSIFEAFQFIALLIVLRALVEQNVTAATAWVALGTMAVSVAGAALFWYLAHNSEGQANYRMCGDKRIHIGERMKYMPMGYFNSQSLGALTAAATTTMEEIEGMSFAVIARTVVGIIRTLVFTVAILCLDWRVGIVFLLGVLLFLWVNAGLLKKSRQLSPERIHAQTALVDAALEYIQGMSVVRAFRGSRAAEKTMNEAIGQTEQKNFKLERKRIPYNVLEQIVLRVAAVAAILLSVWLFLHGSMSLFTCLMMTVSAFLVYSELESAGEMFFMLPMIDASISQVDAIDQAPRMDEGGSVRTPQSRDITFDHVDFSYGERKIIQDVSFTVPEGTTTAIVGPSGSGKTTLTSLMARFWDVDSGSVKLGGIDVKDYALDSLMSNFSMVFQTVYLFNDSIENNIKFGKPDATHEEVVAAAKAARCHDFISALPEGYDTVIGEGGATLSGGERQRLSIARAMLKDAPIVILDEATANVDPENEADLQEAIEALTGGKTIIMIAHRLKTVRRANQILVLEHGRITQRGTHEQLMQEPGIYADFIRARQKAVNWKIS